MKTLTAIFSIMLWCGMVYCLFALRLDTWLASAWTERQWMGYLVFGPFIGVMLFLLLPHVTEKQERRQ